MKFIKHYNHEIYTVITLLLLTLSAIFVTPDITQKLALAYAFLFLLHEWEENNYPGGFFDMLFGEVMNFKPMPSKEKIREARIFVYLLLITLTFIPYFAHTYTWLILPLVYLGIIEGLIGHTLSIKVFKMNRKYTPGMVTALCLLALSIFTLWYVIRGNLIMLWQYGVGLLIIIVGLFCMARFGMAVNGIKFSEVPKMIKRNLKELRNR
jgi:hypothetical protein